MKNPNVTKTINLPYNNLQRSGAGLRSLVNTVPACFILSKTRLVQSVTAIGWLIPTAPEATAQPHCVARPENALYSVWNHSSAQ